MVRLVIINISQEYQGFIFAIFRYDNFVFSAFSHGGLKNGVEIVTSHERYVTSHERYVYVIKWIGLPREI